MDNWKQRRSLLGGILFFPCDDTGIASGDASSGDDNGPASVTGPQISRAFRVAIFLYLAVFSVAP